MEPAEWLKGGVVGCDGDGANSLKIRLVMCRETVLCAGYVPGKIWARGKVFVGYFNLCATYVPKFPMYFVWEYRKTVMYGVCTA